MNTNAANWVKALRSGKYQQSKGALKDAYGFCCLGVACELYAIETGVGNWDRHHQSVLSSERGCKFKEYCSFDGEPSCLPLRVKVWLGLEDAFGRYKDAAEEYDLATQNDRGLSFEDIASIIESEPEGLFNQ